MKPLLLCLVALALIAAPCAAQTASPPSARVPPNTWPFVAADTILAAGMPFGYPDGTYQGRRLMPSRYEFAVAVTRVLAEIRHSDAPPSSLEEGIRSDLTPLLMKSPPALNALVALVHEFSPELSRFGQDVPKATARLAALQQVQRQLIQDKRIVLTPVQLRSPFVDVSTKGWVRSAVDTLEKNGIELNTVDAVRSNSQTMTKLQMAQAIQGVFPHKASWHDIDYHFRSDQARDAMRVLVGFVQPELDLLGVDVATYEQGLEGLGASREMMLPLAAQPLPDVPAGHWAASAVETLRRQGIMEGYPGGK